MSDAVSAPARGLRAWSALLGAPGALPLVAASLVARLPIGMTGLALVLLVRDAGHSYTAAGVVVGAYSLAGAATVPVFGRLVDRVGQPSVLVPLALLFPAALLGVIALAESGRPPAALVAAAALAGAALPPVAACIRALWPALLPHPELANTAYAFEASVQELFFIAGPLIVALLAAVSPAAAVGASAAFGALGTLAFAATPSVRRWRGQARRGVGPLGALATPGVRTVLGASACMGLSFGAIEVAVPAAAEAEGSRAAAGIVLAAFSLGSLVGGVALGAAPAARRPSVRYAAALAAYAAGLLLPLAASGIPALAVLFFVAGLAIAPAFAGAYGLTSALAEPGTATEAFAWISTSVVGGVAAGTAFGGAVVERLGVAPALGLAAGAAAVAAVTTAARRPTLESGRSA
jgi:MFS family permease